MNVNESNKVLQTEMLFFADPKDRQVKHYPNKKAVALSISSG